MKPALIRSLKGYSRKHLISDVVSGTIVGIVALPLAIAFAIASGLTPESGLYTAIVAGFIISALGGSKVQIGGPTGAFAVIVYGVILKYGLDGLIIATFMAGVLLVILGLLRLGAVIRFIPYPVITGFTSGIAVVIFSTQVKDFLGLEIESLPSDFLPKWAAYLKNAHTFNPETVLVSVISILIILYWPRVTRKIPSPFIALVFATSIVHLLGLEVETIGDRFGGMHASFPHPALPSVTVDMISMLLWPAMVIAMLGAIESLLSAVVADGMIGEKHDSNMELVAQGLANIASPLFGGMPATGAIARTVTNIKSGGRTPIAGMTHAAVLLLILAVFGKLVVLIPIATLAAVLVVVSYHMSEARMFRTLVTKAPKEDAYVLLVTFLLTVLTDLTVGVTVGIVLSFFLMIKKLVLLSNVDVISAAFKNGERKRPIIDPRRVRDDIQIYEIRGPFFFGAVYKFKNVVDVVATPPKVIILRMRWAFTIDATGLHAIETLVSKAKEKGTVVLISGLNPNVYAEMERFSLLERIGKENIFKSAQIALKRAEEIAGKTA